LSRTSLFSDAYSGRVLSVSVETHVDLSLMFPELNSGDEYRDADAWLLANPRKRPKQNGTKRFLINWFRKSEKARLREQRKQMETSRQSQVGSGPSDERNLGGFKVKTCAGCGLEYRSAERHAKECRAGGRQCAT
jgi:hypothetical protein